MRSISLAVGSERRSKVIAVAGAILVGGKSLRFGSNKALFLINGIAMGRKIADTVRSSGIEDVIVVGGSSDIADLIGCSFVADLYPDEGPLGGLITAMRAVTAEILCVLPCDVPLLTSARIQQLLTALTDFKIYDASVLTSDREHWLCSSWRVSRCLPTLEERFTDGERAIHRAVNSLVIQRVSATDSEMINVNTLQDARDIGLGTEIGD